MAINQDTTDQLVQQQIDTGHLVTDENDLIEISSYLTNEILDVLSGAERGRFEDKVEKWRRQSEGRPEQESRDYPWEGSSNVVPPLALTNSHGIFSMLKNSIDHRKPLWTIEDTTESMRDEANAITSFLSALAESKNHINLRKVNNTALFDLARLGTQFVKIPWTIDRKTYKKLENGAFKSVTQTLKDSPTVIPVRLEDVITRPFWYDVQTAPYIGRRVWLMDHTLTERAAQGVYDSDVVEKVLDQNGEVPDERWEKMLQRAGIDPTSRDTKMFPIFEMNYYYDVDHDGVAEDIIVWIDVRTGLILRTELNELGMRDWVRIPYFDLPYELYAMGTGWMVESLQDESEALHNMAINSLHISSLQMYVTKRGSRVAPGQKFRPLLNIEVDDPSKDFMPVKFPDIGYSIFQREMATQEYANRATGVSDAMLGYENRQLTNRGTLGGTMFLAQQGSKTFNSVLPNVESAYAEIGQIILYRCIQEKDRILNGKLINLIPPDQQEALKNVLDMDLQDIPYLFNFRVETTDAEKSEEAKKQNLLTMVQLYTMYGKQVFSLLPIAYNPQVPDEIKATALKFFTGATELMSEIMKDFGENDTRKYLPYVKNIEMMLSAMDMMKAQQVGGMNNGLSQNGPDVSYGGVVSGISGPPYPTGPANPAAGGGPQGPGGPPGGGA